MGRGRIVRILALTRPLGRLAMENNARQQCLYIYDGDIVHKALIIQNQK